MVYNSVKSLNVQSAATATVLCAATIVTAVATTVRAVATAADENEKDDNPAAVTAAEEAVTHVIFLLSCLHCILLRRACIGYRFFSKCGTTGLFVYESFISTN